MAAVVDAGGGDDVRIDALGKEIGVRSGEEKRPGGWFLRVARWYLGRRVRRDGERGQRDERRELTVDDAEATARAHRAITVACLKSAISGALAGSVSTGATVVTASTEGAMAFAAVPVAVGAIGGEMLYRSVLHLDLTCDLAAIFGLDYDPSHEEDLFRLYALAFGTSDHDDEAAEGGDPGKELVREVTHVESEDVGEKIGHLLLGESLMRNVVPVVGVVSSAVTNVVLTRKVGHTVHRYFRYQRAFRDTFEHAIELLRGEPLDLLIEGMWFIFTADGKLAPEEAACLASMVHKLPPDARHAVTHRFVEDEHDWTERLAAGVPEPMRGVFLHALEVAAAVDKQVGVPERKILRRAARKLGVTFDPQRVEQMMREFEDRGVLSHGLRVAPVAAGAAGAAGAKGTAASKA